MTYTEIYQDIYKAMKTDNVNLEKLNWASRRITEAIWDLCIMLENHQTPLPKTLECVKDIINKKING